MHEDKSGADNAGAPVDFDDPLAGLSPESREIVMRQARALRSEGKAQREANADPLPGALDGGVWRGDGIGGGPAGVAAGAF